MMIRVAIVEEDIEKADLLKQAIVSFSCSSFHTETDVEVDVAKYTLFSDLEKVYNDIDIAFLSYDILRKNLSRLNNVYKKNPLVISVPVGLPDDKICDFLMIRPAGHLRTVSDKKRIDELCRWCASEVEKSNDVLQIATRQGIYAISASSILFCQSNQKYVLVVTEKGTIYRKLAKLDQIALNLPQYFMRVHQSYLVNPNKIRGLDKSGNNFDLLLSTGIRVPVSRIYQKATEEQIQKLLYNYQK